MPSLIVGKRSTYQEPIEEEVGSTSCGGTEGLGWLGWDGMEGGNVPGSCSSGETELAEVGSMK